MPFSLLKKNTVFLIANAILKNFYLHLLDVIGGRVTGLDGAARLKALTTNVCHRTRKVDKIRSLDVLNSIPNDESILNWYAKAPERETGRQKCCPELHGRGAA